MRNEFKNTARQILLSSYYDIFPCPNSQNAEHSEQYTAAKVKALLDQKTGTWMHKYENVSDVVARVATQC